jgi:hypothetical protein
MDQQTATIFGSLGTRNLGNECTLHESSRTLEKHEGFAWHYDILERPIIAKVCRRRLMFVSVAGWS